MTARGAVSGLARLGGIGLGGGAGGGLLCFVRQQFLGQLPLPFRDGHVLGQVVAVVLHRKRTPLGMFDVLRFGSAALLPT
jgi:hypothetical protein